MTDKHEPTAFDEVLAWLDTLPPIQRARWLGALLDTRNARGLTAVRVDAIYEETRRRTYDEVAAELGVSRSAVRNAVKAHNERLTVAGEHGLASWPDATESTQNIAARGAQREEQQ
jgi:DNA-directed RNA polymerase specialized sigma subunit